MRGAWQQDGACGLHVARGSRGCSSMTASLLAGAADEEPEANEERSGERCRILLPGSGGPRPTRAKRKGLSFGIASRLRGQRYRSTVVIGNCDLGPITVVPHRAKAGLFGRSSILFRPLAPAMNGTLVESPGTAPGSEPIITGAFIAIVGVAPDRVNIGVRQGARKVGCPQWTIRINQGIPTGWLWALEVW